MSTPPNNNSSSNTSTNRLFNRIANTYIHSDSIIETNTTPAPVDNDNEQSPTWIDSLTLLDRVFSGGLLRLSYDLIDIVLLFLGLYYGTRTCSVSNALAIISVCILVFSGLGLIFIFIFLIRNWSSRRNTLSNESSSSQYRQGYVVRAFFDFLRFICICIGTAFVFTSKKPVNNNCEILRFYLGIVCFNTWVLMVIRLQKPSLLRRRSLISEVVMLLLSIIFHCIFFGFVAFAMIMTRATECIYTSIDDLYFRAPLKSFAYVGLILIGCSVGRNILAAILNQLFYRVTNFRRVIGYLGDIHYIISYLITIVVVYYFSVGAVLLFPPRSGGSCRVAAPDLYKTFLIWEVIRVFLPFAIGAFACLVCCLGVTCGACLAVCLPASITVPLLETLRETLPNVPGTTNPDPPASPGTIDALPMVVFGATSDEFNQTECAICRSDYEANEEIKRLQCGHLFHAACVTNWLTVTRICPVCRQRITPTTI